MFQWDYEDFRRRLRGFMVFYEGISEAAELSGVFQSDYEDFRSVSIV